MVIPDLSEIEGWSDLGEPIAWIELLRTLATGRADWRDPKAVAQAAGLAMDQAADMLAALDMVGWIDCDDDDEIAGLKVCLSCLGSDRLGVKITEAGPGEVPIWSRANYVPQTRIRRQPHQIPLEEVDPYPEIGDDDQVDLGCYEPADPRPGPAELVEAAEEAELAFRKASSVDPYPKLRPPRELYPSLILGINAQWQGPRLTGEGVCPGCLDKPLQPSVACVYDGCDRWGGVEKPVRSRLRRKPA